MSAFTAKMHNGIVEILEGVFSRRAVVIASSICGALFLLISATQSNQEILVCGLFGHLIITCVQIAMLMRLNHVWALRFVTFYLCAHLGFAFYSCSWIGAFFAYIVSYALYRGIGSWHNPAAMRHVLISTAAVFAVFSLALFSRLATTSLASLDFTDSFPSMFWLGALYLTSAFVSAWGYAKLCASSNPLFFAKVL